MQNLQERKYKTVELGTYKGWRVQCVSNNQNAEVIYMAYLYQGERKPPKMLDCGNLTGLQEKIKQQKIIKRKFCNT